MLEGNILKYKIKEIDMKMLRTAIVYPHKYCYSSGQDLPIAAIFSRTTCFSELSNDLHFGVLFSHVEEHYLIGCYVQLHPLYSGTYF